MRDGPSLTRSLAAQTARASQYNLRNEQGAERTDLPQADAFTKGNDGEHGDPEEEGLVQEGRVASVDTRKTLEEKDKRYAAGKRFKNLEMCSGYFWYRLPYRNLHMFSYRLSGRRIPVPETCS